MKYLWLLTLLLLPACSGYTYEEHNQFPEYDAIIDYKSGVRDTIPNITHIFVREDDGFLYYELYNRNGFCKYNGNVVFGAARGYFVYPEVTGIWLDNKHFIVDSVNPGGTGQ